MSQKILKIFWELLSSSEILSIQPQTRIKMVCGLGRIFANSEQKIMEQTRMIELLQAERDVLKDRVQTFDNMEVLRMGALRSRNELRVRNMRVRLEADYQMNMDQLQGQINELKSQLAMQNQKQIEENRKNNNDLQLLILDLSTRIAKNEETIQKMRAKSDAADILLAAADNQIKAFKVEKVLYLEQLKHLKDEAAKSMKMPKIPITVEILDSESDEENSTDQGQAIKLPGSLRQNKRKYKEESVCESKLIQNKSKIKKAKSFRKEPIRSHFYSNECSM